MARGKNLNRLLSIVLCIAMCTTLFPAAAFAEEAAPGDAAATSGELQPAESQPAESNAPESTAPTEVPTAEEPAGAESAPESTASEEAPPAETPAGAESAPEGTVPEKLPTVETSTSVESAPESTVPEAVPAEESAGVPVAYSDEVSPLSVGDTFTVGGLTYKVTFAPYSGNNASVAVTRAEETITAALIPATIENQGETFSVANIGKGAFSGCNRLASVSIPGSLNWIETSAFENCTALVSLTFSKGFGSIWDYAFAGCTGLKTVYFPETISYVGSGAFSGCTNLETVTFSPLCYGGDIGERAFSGCSSLSSITLPPSNFSVGAYAFEDCAALTSITYPKGLSQLQEGTFKNCTALRDVTVHHDVSSVGTRAFENCNNLSVVHFDGNAAQWNQIQIASDNDPLKNASVQYTTESYPIYYVLYGGTNSASNPTGYDETSDTIILSAPTKTGYTFAGWYTDSSYTTKITQIAKGSTGAKTLYAKWDVSAYPINYTLNGGNQNAKNPTSYTVDTADIALANPTRKGYNFGGWYTSNDFTTRVTKIAKGSSGAMDLYAKWNLATYKLTYVLDGGTQNANNPATYTFLSENITPASPTRKGCTFAGWYTSSAYTTRVTTIAAGSIGSKTLYAKWDSATYLISYTLNGGNQNAKNPASYTMLSADITLASPTRKGYNFGGWYTSSSFTTRVTTIPTGSSGAMDLYAKWNLATYKLTYVLDGGTQNANNPATYTFLSENITPASPTRKGCTFAGWYTSSAYTTRVTSIPSGSIGSRTLYAKWNLSTYPINYNLNGGNQNAANPVRYTVETEDIKLANPTRKGYNFGGWYLNSSFATRATTIAKGSTGTRNLYAKWNLATYKLTYVLDGGTQNPQNPATYTFTTPSITLANPTRANYTFAGWYTSSAYTTKVTTIASGSIGSKTLYAKWDAGSYPINYTLNGGNQNAANPTSYTMATADITLANPSRKGYNFGGWYTSNAFTTRVTTIAKGSTGAKDLYAKWNLATYKLTYTLDGGTQNPQNPATYTFTTPSITLANPTRANYTFAGWYTSSAYTTKVTTIPTGSIGSRTLYAKWDATAYPINYTLNGGNQNAANPTSYTMATADITLASPSRKGYNFGGWYTSNAFTTRVTTIAKGSTGAKNLYAKWNLATYKLTYTLDGGTQNAQNPVTYTFTTPSITLANPTRANYTFAGWYTSSAFITRVTTIPTGSIGSRTLYAKWNVATPEKTYTDTVIAPTCTEAGYTEHKCNETGEITRINVVPATGHNYDKGVCKNCGEKDPNYKEPVGDEDFSARNAEIANLTNAARAENGLAPLSYCSEFQSMADTRAVEITTTWGHTRPDGSPFYSVFGDAVLYSMGENIQGGCGSPELTVSAWMNSPGHRANILATDFDGIVVGTAKNSNGAVYSVQLFVKKNFNNSSKVVSSTTYAPTCTEDGYTEIVYEDTSSERVDIVKATGHNFVNGTCTKCNEKEVVKTYGVTIVTPPSCEYQGFSQHVCNETGEVEFFDYVPATGHKWNNGVVTTEPTVDTAGVKTFTCTECGKTKTEAIDKITYTYTDTVIEPTCTEKGYTEHKCNETGETTRIDEVPATGHTFISGVCDCGAEDTSNDITFSNNYSKSYFNNTIISDTNALRTSRGASALNYASEYQAQADIRAMELAENYSHTRPNGKDGPSVLEDAGADLNNGCGENIAKMSYAYKPSHFVEMWKNSAGHYTNMVNANWDSFVVGTWYNDDTQQYYAVQIFFSDP